MVQTSTHPKLAALALQVPQEVSLQVTPAQFVALAAVNRELRLERTSTGELIVNPPTGWESGARNSSLTGELYLWWRRAGEPGKVFDSSTGFTLSNGAIRSSDASWVSQARWEALAPEQKQTFANICPDFVVELRSPSDRLPLLPAKLQEYIDNGAQLGWLIDPLQRRVEIYHPGAAVVMLAEPTALSGETVLPGFELDLRRVWG
ncbi:MAG: Uma2 family endonuclease [Spirulinaceae cyanobacterium SM2_1_0]|nr:Uma2 family endonuclease [Spirulinaceae cyanobacterium SM2_1_0]